MNRPIQRVSAVLLLLLLLVAVAVLVERTKSMGFWDSLLGKPAPRQKVTGDLSRHRAYLDSLRQPAIHLVPASAPVFSHLGGLPSGPAGFEWPLWQGKPQSFLAQIDLAAVPVAPGIEALPRAGVLLFFYDSEQGAWGFDIKDRGNWRVYYFESTTGLREVPAPKGLDEHALFKSVPLQFAPIQTYPDWQDARVQALQLKDGESDAYFDLCAAPFGKNPTHQLLGYPGTIQDNDMDLQCQLVTNGLYCGDSTGYNDSRRAELVKGRSDWVLLLQLDTDDATGMMWGDVGKLYFWIRKQDLARRDFSNVWMIMQCS
jgi:uncharacterized protein YwqG